MKKKLFIVHVLLLLAVFSVSSARGENNNRGNSTNEYEYNGALDIRIHPAEEKLYPPAELLLIDQKGRKTGSDPRTHKTYMEIPHSAYEEESISDAVTGTPGPVTKIIYIKSPEIGEYILQVIGKESHTYDLEIRGYDCELNPSDDRFMNVKLEKNSVHKYIIQYSNEKGSKIKVTSREK